MKPRIHIYLPTLLFVCISADSQKISKNDKLLLANLQTHIRALSADTAGGRTTAGEKAVADYVISELNNAGARPKGDNNGWLQTFTVDEGRQIGGDALLTVDEHPLVAGKEWFPLSLSPAGEVKGSPAIALPESGVPWFLDLREWMEAGSGNPRSDLVGEIRAKAISCAKKGATALILYNSSTRYPDKLTFDPRDKPEAVVIPVVYITREAKQKYLKDESASADIRIRVSFTSKHRTGHNVVGFLDNGAATTAVIGTRFGNRTGLAAMIELARLLAISKLQGNNYLFVAFSGSDPGWLGSEYYTAHPAIDLKKVNYVLELDRLGGSGDLLNIGGYNTSSAWGVIGDAIRDSKSLSLHYDSSAVQPGDHTAFYRQQIPVLVFSARQGPASDPIDPINYAGELETLKFIYALIEGANSRGRLTFTP
jgi:aminopeptidase YwaD